MGESGVSGRGTGKQLWNSWLREFLGEEISLTLIAEAHAVTREEMADMGEKPKAKAKGATA